MSMCKQSLSPLCLFNLLYSLSLSKSPPAEALSCVRSCSSEINTQQGHGRKLRLMSSTRLTTHDRSTLWSSRSVWNISCNETVELPICNLEDQPTVLFYFSLSILKFQICISEAGIILFLISGLWADLCSFRLHSPQPPSSIAETHQPTSRLLPISDHPITSASK